MVLVENNHGPLKRFQLTVLGWGDVISRCSNWGTTPKQHLRVYDKISSHLDRFWCWLMDLLLVVLREAALTITGTIIRNICYICMTHKC